MSLLVCLLVLKFSTYLAETKVKVCTTKDCLYTANEIKNNLDPSINPCDDFYEFACGNFIKRKVIPDEQSTISYMSTVADLISGELSNLLDKEDRLTDSAILKKVEEYYDACMDLEKIERKAHQEALKAFVLLGKWPVLEKLWFKPNYHWEQHSNIIQEFGFGYYIFDIFVENDILNSTANMLWIRPSDLGLPLHYWNKGLQDPIVQHYKKMMWRIVNFYANYSISRRQIGRDMMAVFHLERKLAKAVNATTEDYGFSISFAELVKTVPHVKWKYMIQSYLRHEHVVQDDDKILVSNMDYLKNVQDILKKVPTRTMSNYLLWRVAYDMLTDMPEKFRKKNEEFVHLKRGQKTSPPRWKYCVDFLVSKFGLATGAFFIRSSPATYKSRKIVKEMVGDIRSSFKKKLKNLKWMDENVRESALEKLAAMQEFLMFPDEILNDKLLESYYKNINFEELRSNTFLFFDLHVNQFINEIQRGKFRKTTDHSHWTEFSNICQVNAFYDPSTNKIIIPAGIAQGMVFRKSRPNYVNYATMGNIIGHETVHGFDSQGRQHDKFGNRVNWWNKETSKKFEDMADCLKKQYDDIEIFFPRRFLRSKHKLGKTYTINGTLTIGENIADNGGFKIGYLAYQRWAKKGIPEPKLPGLMKYTNNQMFWISFATMSCAKATPQALEYQLTTDSHAPLKYRVNVPLQNTDQFSEDWKCPVGSPMNPESKCKVW